MKLKQIILGTAVVLLGGIFFNIPTKAEEESSSFYAKAIMPANQIPDTSEYFHIQTDKKIEQEFEILVVNDSTETKIFNLSVLDGMTTSVGQIGYDTTHTYDPSQSIKLSEVSEIKKSVEIDGNDTLLVPINVDVDPGKFSGLLLGAVNVSEAREVDEKASGVVNQFAYNIPIKIDVKTSDVKGKLMYDGIFVSEENKEKSLTPKFINPSGTILRELTISYKITSKKSNKIVVESKDSGLEVAPTSQFKPSIDLKNTTLKSGKYKIEIQAVSKISDIDEKWTDEFEITAKEARSLNEGLSVEKASIPWYVWAISGAIIISLGILLYRQYQKKKQQNKKKSKKRIKKK